MAPTTSPRSQRAMGALLDRGGDLLVRREGGLGEVMAPPLGLIGEQLGQALMRRAPFLVRRALDHHRLDHRVPEPQLTGAVVDHDEMVAFGRPELIESSRTARRRQGHPGSPEPSSAASRSRRRVGSGSRSILAWYSVRTSRLDPGRCAGGPVAVAAGRCGELQQRQRVALRLVDDAAAGRGSAGGRTGAPATPSLGARRAARRRTPATRRARRSRRRRAGSHRAARSGCPAAAGRRTRRRRRWHGPASAGRR